MFPGESPNESFPTPGPAPTAAPRPISPKRLEANRRNAKHSTGPRTEEGKQRSRLNAGRHFLTGQVEILPDEERAAVEAFCKRFVEEYCPSSLHERLIVRAIAEDYWRIGRARAVENNLFAIDISRRADDPLAGGNPQIENAIHMALTFREDGASFQLLNVYERRAYQNLERNVRRLEQARREHAALRAKALRDAAHLARVHQLLGSTFDLESESKANGGFVFSNVEISAAIERRRLLAIDPDDETLAGAA